MADQKVILTDPREVNDQYEEAIKTLRTNIQYTGMNTKVIMLTSCFPNEGKSDISLQLARELGKIGKHTLFLDADIRKSSLVGRFQIEQKVTGLSQFLSGQIGGKDLVYRTNFPNVDIIFAGKSVANPSELLEQEAFGALVDILRDQYEYIIVDTPPAVSVVDAVVIAKHCDGAVIVIESDAVSYKTAAKMKKNLERSGCRVLGAVLNKVDMRKDRYYSKYSYYYRHEDKQE